MGLPTPNNIFDIFNKIPFYVEDSEEQNTLKKKLLPMEGGGGGGGDPFQIFPSVH